VVAERLGAPLAAYRLGADSDPADRGNRFGDAYGVTRDGVVLVRPDGFVGWRSRGSQPQPTRVLDDVLRSLLGLGPAGDRSLSMTSGG
jgi:putative polyketide hydroxylase